MTEKEYNQCVSQYADNVYRFILKNLGHKEDSQDVVQTAFEKLWVNREQVDNERSKSYLFTVAYHQMIDHIRKQKRITLQEEFKKLGVEISFQDDLMIIKGGQGIKGGRVHSRHDHRIAMACGVAALAAEGEVTIEEAEAVNKSYPQFWEHLQYLSRS
jgi:RNA polymerase sigma factor (sigma-70 family)